MGRYLVAEVTRQSRNPEVTPAGNHAYLGAFGNETVTLPLHSLPAHVAVTILCNQLVLGSWDGNSTEAGPDRWSLDVAGGLRVVDTTFNNGPHGIAGHQPPRGARSRRVHPAAPVLPGVPAVAPPWPRGGSAGPNEDAGPPRKTSSSPPEPFPQTPAAA